MKSRNSVIIVGGGPSGFSMALALAKYGIHSVILEKNIDPTPMNESRALTIMPAGLRFLSWLGIADEVEALSEKRRYHEFRGGKSLLLTLDFDQVKSPFKRVYDIPQPGLERVLEKHCVQSELIEVHRGMDVTAIVQTPETVTAFATDKLGKEAEFSGMLGIGSDGYHSQVRTWLGIKTTKKDYGAHSLVADFSTSTILDQTRSQITLNTDRPFGFFPFQKGKFRLVLRVNEGEKRENVLDEKFLKSKLQEHVGEFTDLKLLWASQFRLAQKQSETYVKDRWILLGDAAHAMGPSAGSGMQLGLLGAWRLSWRIALGFKKSELLQELLNNYNDEHRITATAVQKENELIFRNLAISNKFIGFIRKLLLWCVGRFSAPARQMAEVATLEDQTTDVQNSADNITPCSAKPLAHFDGWKHGARAPVSYLIWLISTPNTDQTAHSIVPLTNSANAVKNVLNTHDFEPLSVEILEPGNEVSNKRRIFALVRPDTTIVSIFEM